MDPTAHLPANARLATRAITAFLFLTGASALVYQVVWTRYLGLLLGSSSVAVVVVLAGFMGGLALGSLGFGRLADRPIRRLTLYAWLELGVGLYCVLFPMLLAAASGPYLALVGSLSASHPAAFTAARLAFAMALLLPPTVLMGGTLPAAIRFLVGLTPGVRLAVGRLYWVNSAGAVLGALVAGFVLIPNLGLDLSLDLGALVNVLVASAALALRQRVGEVTSAEAPADPAEAPLPKRAVRAALAAVTLSGFAALAVEVAWTRLLALVLGGSTYAFTVMVATFILGIALGSRLVTAGRFGRGDPTVWLAGALAVVAALLAASMPLYPRLPWLFQGLRSLLSSSRSAFPLYQAVVFTTAGLVMLLPTIAMGATLPLAARIAASGPAVGSRVGLTWALNTAGTLLGAILTGLVLLPRIGLQATLAVVAACYAVAALVALAGAGAGSRRAVVGVVAAGMSVLAVLALQPAWPLVQLHAGAYRMRSAPGSLAEWIGKLGMKVLWARDGATTSVSVLGTRDDRLLRVNGKTDASLRGDLDTQLLLGHVPAFLAAPRASRALVIGLGSGATVAALASHPELRVTAVEIEPAVVEAARGWFGEVNDGVLDGHPRVEVLVEDAKTVFQRGGAPWDIIVSEPSNPWLAGVGGLFTRDFFEAARARLAPHGVMAQWLQTYELDDETVRLVLRTFHSVFPEVTVWQAQGNDYILIGGDQPLAVDPALLERRFQAEAVRRSLSRTSVDSVAGLLARQVLSPAGVAAAAGPGPVNTDQFPTLEFDAPRGFFAGRHLGLHRGAGRASLRLRPQGAPPPPLAPGGAGRHAAPLHGPLGREAARGAGRRAAGPCRPALAEAARPGAGRGQGAGGARRASPGQRGPPGGAALAGGRRAAGAPRVRRRGPGLPGAAQRHHPAGGLHEGGEARPGGAAGRHRPGPAARRGVAGPRLPLERRQPGGHGSLRRHADPAGLRDPARLVEWWSGEAAARFNLGDLAGARSAATEVLRLDPNSRVARRLLAATAR